MYTTFNYFKTTVNSRTILQYWFPVTILKIARGEYAK